MNPYYSCQSLRWFFTASFCFLGSILLAQTGRISGQVLDAETRESLIGAAVVYGEGKGVAADLDGRFSLPLPYGSYTLSITFIGYEPVSRTVELNQPELTLEVLMKPVQLQEVEIIADLARPRETPVAYSNVSAKQIAEKLGSQDLPMLLNSTPGVYATQVGGGDGDARVSIRGFNSQNVLVMVDGVPMNDMFNGRVFWTNWFGLDQMTRTMQVQRGLGASKLAIPAIGGTINIMTKGMGMERSFSVKQEVGNDLNFRTVLTGSTGRLKGNWNLQGALSFRSNEGYVDGLRSQMFFYFAKINKELGNHTFSLSAFGAPQESGQRSFYYDQSIEQLSKDQALALGIDTSTNVVERGNRYYFGWNHLVRTRTGNALQDSLYANNIVGLDAHASANNLKREFINTTENRFHKPVISFNHRWRASPKFYLNNLAYASFGQGGGTRAMVNGSTVNVNSADSAGQINLQLMYDQNAFNPAPSFTVENQGTTLRRSAYFIQRDHNDHSWYGLLSTFDWKLPAGLSLSGGADARYYNGRVYSTMDDLLGGDVYTASDDLNRMANRLIFEGDTLRQHIERDILWGGTFAMLEFKGEKISAFVNLSGAINGYRQYNHFLEQTLQVGDTTLNIGFGDTLNYQGQTYTQGSEGLETNATEWVVRPGYTVKAGMNYNFTKRQNAFFNVGYFSRVPYFTALVRADNTLVRDSRNEELFSVEMGYSYRSPSFTINGNVYYTEWFNKPTSATVTIDGEPVLVNIANMGARHMGLEVDFAWKAHKMLTVEGMASWGDWQWNRVARGEFFNLNGEAAGEIIFDPTGVKVGDAAQHSYALSLRFMPIKRLYLMPEINLFTHNYADFRPEDYQVTDLETGYGPNLGRQAWRMPDYYFINLHAGYHFYIGKVRMDARGNILNLTDGFYLTDASNNGLGGSTYNASSATVYAGLGTRWMFSLMATF